MSCGRGSCRARLPRHRPQPVPAVTSPVPRGDRLSGGLLDDLQAWNDACVADGADAQVLQERGRALAIQVQGELGSDGWEVLYQMHGRMLRVHPPGSWPVESWKQELLGYHSRSPAERATE